MISIPEELRLHYLKYLVQKGVPQKNRSHYLKWLRFYYDFCQKCNYSARRSHSLSPFLLKLQEKGQPQSLQHQARSAVQLFFELQAENDKQTFIKKTEGNVHNPLADFSPPALTIDNPGAGSAHTVVQTKMTAPLHTENRLIFNNDWRKYFIN